MYQSEGEVSGWCGTCPKSPVTITGKKKRRNQMLTVCCSFDLWEYDTKVERVERTRARSCTFQRAKSLVLSFSDRNSSASLMPPPSPAPSCHTRRYQRDMRVHKRKAAIRHQVQGQSEHFIDPIGSLEVCTKMLIAIFPLAGLQQYTEQGKWTCSKVGAYCFSQETHQSQKHYLVLMTTV